MKKTVAMVILLAACGKSENPPTTAQLAVQDTAPEYETPVVTNAESPVAYPPHLFDAGIEGRVLLRLFVDETGTVHPDSATVVESSGNAQLDSAALRGVGEMQFAPALRDGMPVASTFLQPVEFKNPESTAGSEAQ